MSTTDQLTNLMLDRLAKLDQAESVLFQARVYNFAGPLRDNFARHRRLINEARGHLNAAHLGR